HGEVLPRALLQKGFDFRGRRIPLMSPKGIFKPADMSLPLTITTVYQGPYRDSFTEDGLLAYKYRGTDPRHPDNVGLRDLMARRIPLIYFHAILKGKYLAAWPVYIEADLPQALTFTVALDDDRFLVGARQEQGEDEAAEDAGDLARRIYVTSTFRRRLHQQSFRERVLRAYREQCALCRLRHAELLDAAHILPDRDPEGVPTVENGLALCKLHHAAFDRHFLGITPDYIVQVRDWRNRCNSLAV
ncbi:MAG: HNH endonuclease, partial [Acidobacteriota bacterium]